MAQKYKVSVVRQEPIECAEVFDAGGRYPEVLVPGGVLLLGKGGQRSEERGGATVTVAPFWMDRHEITNMEFAQFVRATGYQTLAERAESEAPAGSAVFSPVGTEIGKDPQSIWRFVKGADWRHPEGPGSTVVNRMQHPVVHVTISDALAYAKWLGRDLPTEAEWEHAAHAGHTDQFWKWPDLEQANIWTGDFPYGNDGADGFKGTAPVGCYKANSFGLQDMIGNVWELTRSAYSPDGHDGFSAAGQHAVKGGSYLCSKDFCARYQPTARQGSDDTIGTSHIGFRTVRRGTSQSVDPNAKSDR